MEQNSVIFDISSDEEPVFGDDDRDWLSNVLGAVDKRMRDGDSDEVVFIGEVNPRKKLGPAVKDFGGGGDCDCVVLDGDPDKPPEVAADFKEDSDECLVVGEKGQVACRDFPHPRHDCALFPFSSSPHEKHCELCHCFVCDKPAPCASWGSGTSSSDHCHANNKNDTWKLLRNNFRLGINPPLQASKPPNPSPATVTPQFNQAQHSRVTRLLPNYRPQQQVARPVVAPLQASKLPNPSCNMLPPNRLRSAARGCSSSTRQGVPSITNQVRSRLPGPVWNKNPVQQRQQFAGVHNTVIWKVRGRNNGSVSPFVPCSALSKRVDTGVTPAVKESTNFSSDSIAGHASGFRQNVTPATASHDRYYNELLELVSGGNSPTCMPRFTPQPNLSTVFTGTVASQPPVASVPDAQPNTGQHISLPQTESQPVSVDDLADLNFCWVNDIVRSVQEPVNSNFQCQNIESTNDQLLASEGNVSSKAVFDEVELPVFDFEQHVPVEVPGEVCMSPDLWDFGSDVFFFDY